MSILRCRLMRRPRLQAAQTGEADLCINEPGREAVEKRARGGRTSVTDSSEQRATYQRHHHYSRWAPSEVGGQPLNEGIVVASRCCARGLRRHGIAHTGLACRVPVPIDGLARMSGVGGLGALCDAAWMSPSMSCPVVVLPAPNTYG